MFLVSSCSCLRSIHWSQVLSWEWRCSWSSADRRCSNYISVINNFTAYQGATYIRGFTVYHLNLLQGCEIWARFLSLAQSRLTLYSVNHRPGYWSNLPCDWPSTAWAYSEQETENGPWYRLYQNGGSSSGSTKISFTVQFGVPTVTKLCDVTQNVVIIAEIYRLMIDYRLVPKPLTKLFLFNTVNIMVTDVTTPCVTRTSIPLILTM